VDWFRSIAFPPNQEQTGQNDNPDSILEKIIGIINSSNPDKRTELVLKLLGAIGFSSDQSIKDYIHTHLNKEPKELITIDLESLRRQKLTSKYIIYLLQQILKFKLTSKQTEQEQTEQNLLDWIFHGEQNLPDTSLSEIKDLIKLILLWDRWCKLKPYTERLPTIEAKIKSESKRLFYQDMFSLEEIIMYANPNLPLLTPESENDSLLRNLIKIIVTNSFKEIYEKALELYLQAKLVIFEKSFQGLKERQKTGENIDFSYILDAKNLLHEVVKFLRSFKAQVSENHEIASRYANIYYEIWLLIAEFKNLETKSILLEIQAFINYLEAIQKNAKMINEAKDHVTQKLTQIIDSINEHITSLYRGLFNNWVLGGPVRETFLGLLEFLENPNRDRLKQKLQETAGLLDEISGLLGRILKIIETINSSGFNLGRNIKEEIQRLHTQITQLKNIIDLTISDKGFANLPNGANLNRLREKLSRLFSLGKK